jgi:RNA recognition motif-containing protein
VKEFAFVGFYDESHVDRAIATFNKLGLVDGKEITVSKVELWMLELFPNRAPGHMHQDIKKPSSLSI